jgi:hypothetical protein
VTWQSGGPVVQKWAVLRQSPKSMEAFRNPQISTGFSDFFDLPRERGETLE